MASLPDHVAQAFHNEDLAAKLDTGNLKYRDWLITIAFYAAVHYVEAFFTTVKSLGHTETACPSDKSRHTFRQRKIKENLGKNCWKSYRKLRNASEVVRYLLHKPGQIGTATDYYNSDKARKLFRDDLKTVRDEVGQHITL